MTAKITAAALSDFGFTPDMFRLADSAALTTYIQTLLDGGLNEPGITTIVSDRVGSSIYTGATGINLARLIKAEKYLAAAELYRRREVFETAEARAGGVEDVQQLSSRLLKRAEEYESIAEDELGRINGTIEGSGIAVGYTESGPYTAVN